MSPEAVIASAASALIMLLLSGNLYFVKRLVDRIDSTGRAQDGASAKMTEVSQTVKGIENQLREVKTEMKDFRRLEIEVAVLKAQYNQPPEALT